jgi:tRNA (guanine37-N1)-methyltransferase
MNFHVLTLFPEMIQQCLNTSITGRAIDKGLITVNTVNIRDFSEDKHSRVDDYPYGGGAGMVIEAEPVYKAYGYLANHIKLTQKDPSSFQKPRVIYVTPQGRIFNQGMAKEFSDEEDLIFLCGHYEGIDERVLSMIVTDNISIGDYVLTGGELPAMVMIDAISRLIPGVLNNEVSSEFESLQDNLLEYPQYTRPEVFMGMKVPEVLLTGHHANIDAWRRQQSILRTYERRPDLLEKAELTEEEREFLTRLIFQKNYDVY